MKNTSLAVRLFKILFLVYLSITIIVTVFQMGYSYYSTKKYVTKEIKSICMSFDEPMAKALWGYDISLLDSGLKGMVKTQPIYGGAIYDEHGGLLRSTPNYNNKENDIVYSHGLYFNDFGKSRYVGKLVVYSRTDEIMKIVSKETAVNLTNTLIKIFVLFFAFFWIIKHYLTVYLKKFTDQLKELNTNDLSSTRIDLQLKEDNELKTLETSFNSLVKRLASSQNELKSVNENLDKLVKERTEQLQILSITDELTGLYNRRFFNESAERELNRCKRDDNSFVFAILDIDDFKKYNDNYGHHRGDLALKTVGNTLNESMHRASDFVYRLGGEEFCIITSGMDREEAFSFLDGIVKKIHDMNIEHCTNSAASVLTISMGVIHVQGQRACSLDSIYRAADKSLYLAKEQGKNRCIMVHCDGHDTDNPLCKSLY